MPSRRLSPGTVGYQFQKMFHVPLRTVMINRGGFDREHFSALEDQEYGAPGNVVGIICRQVMERTRSLLDTFHEVDTSTDAAEVLLGICVDAMGVSLFG